MYLETANEAKWRILPVCVTMISPLHRLPIKSLTWAVGPSLAEGLVLVDARFLVAENGKNGASFTQEIRRDQAETKHCHHRNRNDRLGHRYRLYHSSDIDEKNESNGFVKLQQETRIEEGEQVW